MAALGLCCAFVSGFGVILLVRSMPGSTQRPARFPLSPFLQGVLWWAENNYTEALGAHCKAGETKKVGGLDVAVVCTQQVQHDNQDDARDAWSVHPFPTLGHVGVPPFIVFVQTANCIHRNGANCILFATAVY